MAESGFSGIDRHNTAPAQVLGVGIVESFVVGSRVVDGIVVAGTVNGIAVVVPVAVVVVLAAID